jgi:hypothetical protein
VGSEVERETSPFVEESTAITGVQPTSAVMTALMPTPPAPNTTTLEPARDAIRSDRARTGLDPASERPEELQRQLGIDRHRRTLLHESMGRERRLSHEVRRQGLTVQVAMTCEPSGHVPLRLRDAPSTQ